MGIKLISKNGDFLPLLYKISKHEEEDVKFYVSQKSDIYKNILPSADSPIELDIGPDDTVVFDMVGAGESAEILKSKGYHVVGGGKLNDDLELSREVGDAFMEEHGIRTPKTFTFETFEEARQFLTDNPGLWVFKPNGNLETDLTIVPQTYEGLMRSLPYIQKRCPDDVTFELQEFVDGIEMSTEAWFNGTQFLRPINSTMEEKKFMVDDLGPNTGCAGNVVWAWDDEISDILYNYLFRSLEEPLREAGYLGPLDINGLWAPDGIYGLEWTARFGYDAIQAASLLMDVPLGSFLRSIRTTNKIPLRQGEYALSVRMSIPPYPSEGEVPNVPIIVPYELEEEYGRQMFFSDVMLGEEGLVCAGSDGYVLTVASVGKSITKLQQETLYIMTGIDVTGKQYRTDIGNRVIREKKQVETIIKNIGKRLT